MKVTSLHVHPVKGCHRVDVDGAEVESWGLAGDRRWMVVDPGGRAVTQREAPALARIRAVPGPGGLVLRNQGQVDLDVAAPCRGERVAVELFGRPMEAAPAGPDADAWLSAALDRDVRLVHSVSPGFADAYPLLLANTASLDALNAWLDDPVPMTRFRPNIVVDGAAAWAEDGWVGRRLRVGDVVFAVPKPCDRCVVTTVDQETGEPGREPLHTLGRMRRFPDGLMFGVNLVPEGVGRIAVGDPVTVLPQSA